MEHKCVDCGKAMERKGRCDACVARVSYEVAAKSGGGLVGALFSQIGDSAGRRAADSSST